MDQVSKTVKQILQEFPLCDGCLGRQFPIFMPQLDEKEKGSLLRRKAGEPLSPIEECYICGCLMSHVDEMADTVLRVLEEYEYESFLIGASLPHDYAEREDRVRASFKLKGGETMKNQLTREVGRRVASRVCKQVRFDGADVTVVLGPASGNPVLKVQSKPVYLFGRYLKMRRGLLQRSVKYMVESGHGSVEEFLSRVILRCFGGSRVKYSWLGSEDRDSLVLGGGRPFYAEVCNPKFRSLRDCRGTLKSEDGSVVLRVLRVLGEKPRVNRDFEVDISGILKVEGELSAERLREAEAVFKDAVVQMYPTGKRKFLLKKVRSLVLKPLGEQEVEFKMTCDGGLNIKKFVSGCKRLIDGAEVPEVDPNLSFTFGVDARCLSFDVLDVRTLKKC